MRLISPTASFERAFTVCVAPSSVAKASFSSERSTATIWRAPASLAPSTTLRPTPPRPTTATDWPGSTLAVLTTAPTPVSTAQPNSAASSSGRSGSILTQDSRAATAWVAKAETPRRWLTGSAWNESRRSPESSVPAAFALAPGSHSAGRPPRTGRSGRSSGRTPARRDRRRRGRSPRRPRLDNSRRLVAERHRHRTRPRAVDHRQVRMAEARRRHLHQHFAAAGGAKIELGDFERLRLGVRGRRPGWRRTAAWMRMRITGLGTGNPDAGRDRRAGQPENEHGPRAALAPRMRPRHMTAKPASASCGRRPEPHPCRRPRANFSTIFPAS